MLEESSREKLPPGLVELVEKWLQGDYEGREVRLTRMETLGIDDWAGNTIDGFHSEFGVTLYYEVDGERKFQAVEGEDMASLWMAVVGGYEFMPPSRTTPGKETE